ncbi:PaaI family thioesterase [Sphingomonas sp. ASV193]|uniref:PaaI family thioesterase n=1 Tax=Sphingomonas sp. ASV193 TaxID=3144405 RepID=UPI0032E8D8DF
MTDLPPYAKLLRLSMSDGLVTMPFHDDVLGRPGFLHGGAIAGLLEFAAFEALKAALGDEPASLKPISVTVDYMRGGAARHGQTSAKGTVERLGKRIANVEAIAWQHDPARPIAAARINFLVERASAAA